MTLPLEDTIVAAAKRVHARLGHSPTREALVSALTTELLAAGLRVADQDGPRGHDPILVEIETSSPGAGIPSVLKVYLPLTNLSRGLRLQFTDDDVSAEPIRTHLRQPPRPLASTGPVAMVADETIVEIARGVYRRLGPARPSIEYRAGLAAGLRERGYPINSRIIMPAYNGEVFGIYEDLPPAAILVQGVFLVEAKATPDNATRSPSCIPEYLGGAVRTGLMIDFSAEEPAFFGYSFHVSQRR